MRLLLLLSRRPPGRGEGCVQSPKSCHARRAINPARNSGESGSASWWDLRAQQPAREGRICELTRASASCAALVPQADRHPVTVLDQQLAQTRNEPFQLSRRDHRWPPVSPQIHRPANLLGSPDYLKLGRHSCLPAASRASPRDRCAAIPADRSESRYGTHPRRPRAASIGGSRSTGRSIAPPPTRPPLYANQQHGRGQMRCPERAAGAWHPAAAPRSGRHASVSRIRCQTLTTRGRWLMRGSKPRGGEARWSGSGPPTPRTTSGAYCSTR